VIRAPGSQPPVADLIREGLERLSSGDPDAADAKWGEIRLHYPGHPAAPTFELRTLEIRESIDYRGSESDEAMRAKAKEALELSEEWLERVPDASQAHFYAGQAKFDLMLLDAIKGRYYKAGSQGEAARKHLERALELDPTLVDAKLPLGTYYYYASIATRYIRWFTWLWFIPTGERELGLAYIEETSREGEFLQFQASVQLAQIYLYLEEQPEAAKPILARLRETHPDNSYLAFEIVELRLIQKDYPGTVRAALALERDDGQQFGDSTRRTMAQIWRARAELYLGDVAQAEGTLDSVELGWGSLTPWCRRWLLLTRAQLHDVEGQRDHALDSYQRVVDSKSRWGSSRSMDLAREGLEAPFVLGPPAVAAGR